MFPYHLLESYHRQYLLSSYLHHDLFLFSLATMILPSNRHFRHHHLDHHQHLANNRHQLAYTVELFHCNPHQLSYIMVSQSKKIHIQKHIICTYLHFFQYLLNIIIRRSSTRSSFASKSVKKDSSIPHEKLMRFKLLSDPYLKGEVIPWQDRVLRDASQLHSKVKAVVEDLHSLNRLAIKLKVPKEELLQTRIANSLEWAEKDPSVECDVSFIAYLAERISFRAFQPISGSTQSEMFKLQKQKLRAMDAKDTLQRLDDSLKLINENISYL
ncbi:hypothetical protein K2173_009287 [Erythroxylum novogranatense]|uniref:Uncharacterized protein n=1 Tax=Erythroxylum novogranatense TaxID=1862640 RepID=A0AAV8SYT4_9ROSI|nr:hypothetical protein K2173_009287 [Erythroxylum novogranatense]